jgi:hypothetical protein
MNNLNHKTMKRILSIMLAVGTMTILSSCGINMASISNHNANETQVQLSNNNFKVVDKIYGSAEVSYVLIFGGLNMKQLYENAYSAMMEKANLKGGPRAVINLVTEERLHGFPPFYYTRTVTVSDNVIEFTK